MICQLHCPQNLGGQTTFGNFQHQGSASRVSHSDDFDGLGACWGDPASHAKCPF